MKKLIMLLLTMAVFASTTQGINAAEQPKGENVISETLVEQSKQQSEALEYYNKVFVENNMFLEFDFNEKGELTSSKEYNQLQSEYNMSNVDMAFIKDFVNFYNSSVKSPVDMKSRLAVRDFRVYMTYNETKSYLGTVITSGPIAVTGALAVLGATVGGPLGAVICGVAGLYGASYIVDVTKQAMRQKRGVWIGWGGIGIN